MYPSVRQMFDSVLFSLSGVCGPIALDPAFGDSIVGVVSMGVCFGRLSVPIRARFSWFRCDVSLCVLNMIVWMALCIRLRACTRIFCLPPSSSRPKGFHFHAYLSGLYVIGAFVGFARVRDVADISFCACLSFLPGLVCRVD